MTCEGTKRATITLTFADNTEERIISDNPGVTVSTTPKINDGKVEIHLIGTAYNGSCQVLPNYDEFRGVVDAGTQVSLVQRPGGICPSGVEYDVQNAGASTGTEWVVGSVSIKQVVHKSGCVVDITDRTGKVYSKFIEGQACPTYMVGCDNDCPDGYIKCTITSYPGYCCIPCSEVKGEIANITAMLRNVTHG